MRWIAVIRKAVETALVRIGMVLIPRMSRPAVLRLGGILGAAAYRLASHLRRVGLCNLDIAFGSTRTTAEKRAILKESFATFALVMLDMFWFSRDTRNRIDAMVRLDSGYDRLLQARPFVCVTAHLGNWEVVGQATALRGIALASVAAPLENEAVDDLFNRMRTRTGQVIVPRKGAVRRLLQFLRNAGKIALVLDQNTKPSQGGIFVEFFGLEVPVSTAAASLALRSGAEIFLGFCVPRGDGTYEAYTAAPIAPPPETADRNAVMRKLTEQITAVVREQVEQHPGRWLWMYKRWKYVAPGRRREEYPFYAKILDGQELAHLGVDVCRPAAG